MTTAYPTLISTVTTARSAAYAERVLHVIGSLAAAKEAGSIANPVYVNAKDVLGRAIEDAWNAVRRPVEPRYGEGMPKEATDFAWQIAFISGGIHGWHRTIQKRLDKAPTCAEVQPLVTAARAFVDEVAPIAALFAFFAEDKTRIVKRQPKAESEAEARFRAPAATTEATRQVKEMLETLVNGQFEALVAAFQNRYRNEIARFVRVRDMAVAAIAVSDKPNRPYRLHNYARDQHGADISFLAKVLDDEHGRGTPVVRSDAEQTVAKVAREDAEEVRAFFVAKNLKKIVSIIEAKEKAGVAMTSCAPVTHTISLAGLEGAFVVDFADGSAFRFSNAVVFKTSIHGTVFQQFPLRFHDVVLPGGVKMGRPSEERMNTVFLGKEAA